jgi:hypothetical protein
MSLEIKENDDIPTAVVTTMQIPGYLDNLSLENMLLVINMFQRHENIDGNLMEVGVMFGRFVLLLAQLTQKDEKCLAIDLFDNQNENVDHSGESSLGKFKLNMSIILTDSALQRMKIVEINSLALTADDLMRFGDGNKFRIISVDGGHTCVNVVHDLELSAAVLVDGGCIIVDDAWHTGWRGVNQGLRLFLDRHRDRFSCAYISPLVNGCNKAIIVHNEFWQLYHDLLAPFGNHIVSPDDDLSIPDQPKATNKNVPSWN